MNGESFAASGRTALVLAYSAARRMAHSCISSEHILLGICSAGSGAGYLSLREEGLSEARVEEQVRLRFGGANGFRSAALTLSAEAAAVIESAAGHASAAGEQVEDRHLLLSILYMPECGAMCVLSACGADVQRLCARLTADSIHAPRGRRGELKFTLQYGRDMVAAAAAGKYDPVIGREAETERVMRILSRRSKCNPVLLGDAGVGKTAIAEALAQRLAAGAVPPSMRGRRLISIDLSSVVAGTKYRGEFEEKFGTIVSEVRAAGDTILFIDELHTISGAGAAEGAIDASNILKPALARSGFQLLGATTAAEYKKYIRRDPALARRFQPVEISEPSEQASLKILAALRPKYEHHHRVTADDAALAEIVRLSGRYIPERRYPDKAIDLLDEACAQAAAEGAREVSAQHITKVLSQMCGISAGRLGESERELLSGLSEALRREVIGQDEAVEAVCRAVRCGRLFGAEGRPRGALLFCGPSGVGKTKLAKALARELFGSERSLLRFDMSEYMEKHSASRLVGSPPGYVGYGEGGRLTEGIRRHPDSVVLFDELEKAHPDVLNLLLQLLDEGFLTDGEGERADFSNAIVIMTSNAGAERAECGEAGFVSHAEDAKAMKSGVMRAVKRLFRPEFVNRMDEIVVFRPLSPADMEKIAQLELAQTASRLQKSGIVLEWNEEVVRLLAQGAAAEKTGARTLHRAVERSISSAAAEQWLCGRLSKRAAACVRGGKIEISCL